MESTRYMSNHKLKYYNTVAYISASSSHVITLFSLSFPVTRMKLRATGMYPLITNLIFDEWQEVWNCCAGNKLHAIRPIVGDYIQKTCLSRRDSVLLNRLRIGHTC